MPFAITLLGCGHPYVRDLLDVIAGEGDLRLAGVWDADPSAIPGPVSNYAVRDCDTAIARADAVIVCAPTRQRPALCARAAQAGRPILVAPPVAHSAAEARLLARELSRSRTPAVAATFLRELPALAQLRGVLRSGVLGRLARVRAGLAHAGSVDARPDGPSSRLRDPGGVGGFGDLAVHLVDALAALGAPPRLDAISLDRAPGGGDLGGVGVGRWDRVPLAIDASWTTVAAGLELAVDGARASAIVRDGVLEISDGGSSERWVGSPPHAGDALRALAVGLRARRLPRDGLACAIRAQAVIESAMVTD